ncbi:MAG TPA: type III-B CRISPR module-associated protein Cmr5 [Candidatus Paceibacterota bacterium]|nr:hypothetical protein [Verrucomicrobiota bacterium]HOX00984.1 type III-B CRISPR module-associated protein Cmr5 [Verrucomicrobiota bacterium]HRZ43750.1 type III-B CRISPR module-associated protein Cmr5 [Candidatus Paceibacterota bacterium]HRZ91345.1 type III-B CRISPR module-associated protein Cmr5 [Candidatus Paceibacterota bacterium]
MKNVEQLRAAHALRFWQSDAGRRWAAGDPGGAARDLATLILQRGLLGAMGVARGQGGAAAAIAASIADFLSPAHLGLLPAAAPDPESLIQVLTGERSDSLLLQRATSEALIYLGHLRRLAPANPAR